VNLQRRIAFSPTALVYLLKAVAVIFLIPDFQKTLFAPFIVSWIQSPSLDPWSDWINKGGRVDSFPYGISMFVLIALFAKLALTILPDVQQAAWIGMGSLLLLCDFIIYRLLKNQFGKSKGILLIWTLSPLVFFVSYIHGQLDLIPTSLIFISFILLRSPRWELSGVLLALSCSAKWSMVLALPFIFVFLVDNPRYLSHAKRFLFGFIPTVIIGSLPALFSSGYRTMVLGTSESAKAFTYRFALGANHEILILPIVYVALLYWMWRTGRSTVAVLLAFSGAGFLSLSIATPSGVGWYLWGLPFITLFCKQKDKVFNILFSIFQVLVVTWYLGVATLATLRFSNDVILQILWKSEFTTLMQTFTVTLGVALIASMLRDAVSKGDTFHLGSKPLSIAIAGDSGVGKDTLTSSISYTFGEQNSTIILGDDYHLFERGDAIWSSRTHLSPEANDLDSFERDIRLALIKKSIVSRHYDHEIGRFAPAQLHKITDLVLINGLHSLLISTVKSDCDLRVFLEMEENIRQKLKINRDVNRRHVKKSEVIKSIKVRATDSRKHIQPQANSADLIFRLSADRSVLSRDLEGNQSVPLILEIESIGQKFLLDIQRELTIFGGVTTEHKWLADNSERLSSINVSNMLGTSFAFMAEKMIKDSDQLFLEKPFFKDGTEGLMALMCFVAIANKRRMLRNY